MKTLDTTPAGRSGCVEGDPRRSARRGTAGASRTGPAVPEGEGASELVRR
jgi:hypothetical protein